MPFAPEYVNCVLRENFEDAKALFLDALLAIHRAHLVMLADRGIVSRDDARALRDGLDAIDLGRVRQAAFDGTAEDLFFHVDRLVAAHCGDAIAGRLHTARSRNDIDMTMYRMRQRARVLDLLCASLGLRETLIALADQQRETDPGAAHPHAAESRGVWPVTPTCWIIEIDQTLHQQPGTGHAQSIHNLFGTVEARTEISF